MYASVPTLKAGYGLVRGDRRLPGELAAALPEVPALLVGSAGVAGVLTERAGPVGLRLSLGSWGGRGR